MTPDPSVARLRVVPTRIQRTRARGWRAPADAIFVGRPTKWGNPWQIVPVHDVWFPFGDAADVIHRDSGSHLGRFERYTRTPGTGAPYWAVRAYESSLTDTLINDAKQVLAGHPLMCWCPLDQPCHADVLLRIANQP